MARLMIIGSIPDSLIRFRGDLIKLITSHKHEVIACSKFASEELKAEIKKTGAKYEQIPFNRTSINPLTDFKCMIAIYRLFMKWKPDIVMAYTIKPVIYGSLCARLANVPIMTSMVTGLGYAFTSGSVKKNILKMIIKNLYRISIKNNKTIFFQNKDDLLEFRRLRLIQNNVCTVLINGSGVDVDRFFPAAFPEQISFLLIARLLKDKGIREYAEAARIIKNRHPGVRFRLVGFIDEHPNAINKQDLQSWVDEGIIEYLGSMKDVRNSIADSSIYVLPSYREGTPRTVLEAMAMGRPIITTNAPGCRETVVNGQNGFLVNVMDVPSLVTAMEIFIEQPSKVSQMGAISRKIAVQKYDVHKVNRVIIDSLKLEESC